MNSSTTCCLKEIFGCASFLLRLDRKDKGNTNAARPTITRPSIIALKAIGFVGLHQRISE
jgi:hypothetical protein